MISSRYALPFIVLAVMALVPTLMHSYAGLTSEDGRSTQAIRDSFADLRSDETNRKAKWVKKTFESTDWIERTYENREGGPLLLFVGRSYDPKRLYHHPELGLLSGSDLEALGTVELAQKPGRPIHLLKGKRAEGNADLVVYALLYEDQFVDNPYFFQLKNALSFLFQARKPMTLFFVYDASALPERALEDSRAVFLLNEAIDDFLSQT
ncbi:MAG: hypothetical protein VST69_05135 [Nitrospirota bacterium]|nr:hypothetical protein [Nitrospirota bacterium]